MENYNIKIGNGIRMLRLVRNWTQEEMAYRLEMSLPGYGKIERGQTDISISRIIKIAMQFEMKPSEFLHFIEEPSEIYNKLGLPK
ncbi:MAG: helix-turn-helix transcriptional regulator [Cytophagaceae bacterium]|jgi:transcriptional regulator with XRE-family HTH domain|nr:helix-turn-helix transcriptional regulator [Cytophagaceae bacterium]